jgi:response regulator RpfG family c-di-GMP phosphodiesterase
MDHDQSSPCRESHRSTRDPPKQLEMKDFDIIIAENGKKDVERAIAEKPDVILMNSGMPEMDGWGDPNIAAECNKP